MRGTRGGVKPSTPRQIEPCLLSLYYSPEKCVTFTYLYICGNRVIALSGTRGVIWRGWGPSPSLPPPRKKKKRKETKKREKKKERTKGTINNVKLLHIKCCFFQLFKSPIVLKIKIKIDPLQDKLKWRPCRDFCRQILTPKSFIIIIYFEDVHFFHVKPLLLFDVCPQIFLTYIPSDPANYRPIALTCCCCKVLETIVTNELIQYLHDHQLINKHQHGFLKNHSTCTNLLESINDWTISISNRERVVVGYVDFARAFDSVSNPKLFSKLQGYGIKGNLLFWIQSFLTNRSQSVCVGSSLSSPGMSLAVSHKEAY